MNKITSILECIPWVSLDYTRYCCQSCTNEPKNEDTLFHRWLPFCSKECADKFEKFIICEECWCAKQLDESMDVYRCFSVQCLIKDEIPVWWFN